MKFTPKTEQELKEMTLWADGIYSFEVKKAEDAVAKNENRSEYVKLVLNIWNNEGKSKLIFPNLYLDYQIKHFCDATGLESKYEAGLLEASDCEGKSGKLHLITKIDKTGKYDPRNDVKDYISAKDVGHSENNFHDDDIPF